MLLKKTSFPFSQSPPAKYPGTCTERVLFQTTIRVTASVFIPFQRKYPGFYKKMA